MQKQEELGRNRKKQEEMCGMVLKMYGMVPKMFCMVPKMCGRVQKI